MQASFTPARGPGESRSVAFKDMKGRFLMRRMSAALLAAGAATLIAVSGCGSQTAAPLGNTALAAAEALQDSARKSQEVNTYTADIVVDLTGTPQGAGKVQGTMVYQQKPNLAADVTFDQISVGGQTVPGGMRTILLGDTIYLKLDALRTLAGADAKPWIKVDLKEVSEQGGLNLQELFAQAQQYDLANSVKMLTASKDVKAVGTETVGGVETTHYSGTFPVEEAVKQLPAEVQERARGEFAKLKDMKFDAWIDGEGLPRKIQMNGTADDQGTFGITLQFRAFNEPVDISEPPADQVGELPKNLPGTGN
jgi:hypothetical protein